MNKGVGYNFDEPYLAGSADTATTTGSGSGAGTSIVYAADAAGGAICIIDVDCGYGATPTAGLLTIKAGADGNTLVYQLPITTSGAAPIRVRRKGVNGQAVTVNLSDGGNNIVGYLNVNKRIEPKMQALANPPTSY